MAKYLGYYRATGNVSNSKELNQRASARDSGAAQHEAAQLEKLVGSVFADKYELTGLIGSGGMGYVYEAEQIGLGRSVAIKLLRPEMVDARVDWFRAEAMAASRINHPHAVAIYDFGVTDDEVPYLVMERLRGRALSAVIEEEPLSPERIVRIAAQCLSALDEAHACRVVHCDLTADNVIVERLRDGDDFAKVIDFGLARLNDVQGQGKQQVGTAEYVSPEQIQGHPLTPQTDLYAMGILLYEMIVGRTPFAGSDTQVVLKGHLEAEPDAPHHIIPGCPPELGELILDALSKKPEDRPKSAAAMRARLLAVFPSTASPTTRSAARSSRPTPPVRSDIRRQAPTRHTTRLTCVLGKKDSALVGRKEEIAQIVAFCNGERDPRTDSRTHDSRTHSRTMVIEGPHGVGKARLTREATSRAGKNIKIFAGAADPSGLKLPWYPLLSVLEQILGFAGTPTLESLSKAAARCGLPERDVPGLAEAFGLDGPAMQLELAVRRREARAAALRTFLAASKRFVSSVIVFADADRYDFPSLNIIQDLQSRLPENMRLIITCATMPKLGSGIVERLELKGLPPQHARDLAQKLAGKMHTVPDALAIHSITGGSPASVEQLAGWIRLGHGTNNMPSLLVDLVSIRVNRLPAPARRVLQAVAIHGTVAPRALVESTIDEEEAKTLMSSSWTGLLVVELATLTIPTDLVAQVISACTPADVRIRLHRRALEAYGNQGPAGVRAHHADEAGDIDVAYDLYISAGTDSVRRFDDPGAAVWYGRAVSCARRMHAKAVEGALPRLAEASVLLAEVLRQTGEFGLAAGICEEAQLFVPDDKQRAMIHRTLGVIALDAGNAPEAEQHLTMAIGDAIRSGKREFLCQCYLDSIRALDAQDKFEEGTKELREGINIITLGEGLRTTQGPDRLWRLGLKLAERLAKVGILPEANETAQLALSAATRSGNAHARGRVSALLAQICEAAGERSQALRHRSNAIDAMKALGDRRSTAELLIETAKTQDSGNRATTQSGMSQPDSQSALRLAHKLAMEVGWDEGANLSKS